MYIVSKQLIHSLSLSHLGSEEGAVFPPVPWGVSAPGRVCLYGRHVALPLRLHHHLYRAPQVKTLGKLCLRVRVCVCGYRSVFRGFEVSSHL